VQVPRNVWFVQHQSVLAETATIPPGRGCLECEIWRRLSCQDGRQKETAHQEAESSESRLQAAQQDRPGVSWRVTGLLRT